MKQCVDDILTSCILIIISFFINYAQQENYYNVVICLMMDLHIENKSIHMYCKSLKVT